MLHARRQFSLLPSHSSSSSCQLPTPAIHPPHLTSLALSLASDRAPVFFPAGDGRAAFPSNWRNIIPLGRSCVMGVNASFAAPDSPRTYDIVAPTRATPDAAFGVPVCLCACVFVCVWHTVPDTPRPQAANESAILDMEDEEDEEKDKKKVSALRRGLSCSIPALASRGLDVVRLRPAGSPGQSINPAEQAFTTQACAASSHGIVKSWEGSWISLTVALYILRAPVCLHAVPRVEAHMYVV